MKPLPLLAGPHTVLRAPQESDLGLLFALRNNVRLQMLLLAQPRANSLARVQEWVSKMAGDPQCVFFVIGSVQKKFSAIGYIQLTHLDPVHGTADLGICLAESARGKGHAAEALRLLEQYSRDVFNLRKILLRVLASNERAIALYKKVRYRKVGVLRQHFYQQGAFHDVLIMEKILPRHTAGQP